MIVAFDFERDGPAIANIDHAGIFFAGFNQNVRTGGGKFFQFFPRVLVGAMLAPHHREDPELGEVRLASENFLNPLEFVRSKAVLFDQFRSNSGIGLRCFARHRRLTLANSPALTQIAEIGK